jgi:Tol biopolymer transport system component
MRLTPFGLLREKYVAFLGAFDSCNNENLSVYLTEGGGKSRRALGFVAAVIRWLPPGDSVLIVNDGFFGTGKLFKFNLDTMVKTPLGIQTRLPPFDVSNDGKYIFYEGATIDSTSAGGIYCYSLDNGEVSSISPGGNPAVSPDGKLLALSKGPLFVFDLTSGIIRQLYDRGRVPDWTPDGKWILAGDNTRFEIRKTDLQGNTQLITKGFGAPNVSPDGQWVLYQNISADNYDGVWVVRIDGSDAHEYIK